jgi:hypothetical protein
LTHSLSCLCADRNGKIDKKEFHMSACPTFVFICVEGRRTSCVFAAGCALVCALTAASNEAQQRSTVVRIEAACICHCLRIQKGPVRAPSDATPIPMHDCQATTHKSQAMHRDAPKGRPQGRHGFAGARRASLTRSGILLPRSTWEQGDSLSRYDS